jgi:hypothetical protein
MVSFYFQEKKQKKKKKKKKKKTVVLLRKFVFDTQTRQIQPGVWGGGGLAPGQEFDLVPR